MKEQIKVSGKVAFIGQQDAQNVITISLTDAQVEKIQSLIPNFDEFESTPIKEVTDKKTGEISHVFKAHTGFEVNIYETSKNGGCVLSDEITFDDIGRDSRVSIYVTMKDTQYKRKEYVTAYLKDIFVIDFVPYEKYNAFEDDTTEEI